MTVDDESSIGDLPMAETFNAALSNEVESQRRISFGGIWWNASWAHDRDYMMIMSTENMTMIS